MASEPRKERYAKRKGSEDMIFLEPSPVPLDLRDWVPPQRLAEWITRLE